MSDDITRVHAESGRYARDYIWDGGRRVYIGPVYRFCPDAERRKFLKKLWWSLTGGQWALAIAFVCIPASGRGSAAVLAPYILAVLCLAAQTASVFKTLRLPDGELRRREYETTLLPLRVSGAAAAGFFAISAVTQGIYALRHSLTMRTGAETALLAVLAAAAVCSAVFRSATDRGLV